VECPIWLGSKREKVDASNRQGLGKLGKKCKQEAKTTTNGYQRGCGRTGRGQKGHT